MSTQSVEASEDVTDWAFVVCAVFAGVTAALQIGKASAVLATLGAYFGVGLTDTALYLSLFSIGAALFGTGFGILATRAHPFRAGMIGLLLIGAGSLAGSFGESWELLLGARIVEALGLPLVVCTMPALIQANSSGRRRVLAMGIWAAWLPLGITLAMCVSLLAETPDDWRFVLRVCGALPLVAAALLFTARRGGARMPGGRAAPIRGPDVATLGVAGLFAMFQGCYLTVQGFIPSIAVEAWSFDPASASQFAGLAALLVIVGNLGASALLSRGARVSRLYILSMIGMALTAGLVLTEVAPTGGRLGAALLFTTLAGVPPAVIWAMVPRLSQGAGIAPAIVSGVLYQGAGIGQMTGPVLTGSAVEWVGGWEGGVLVTSAFAAAGVWIAARTFRNRKALDGQATIEKPS